MIAIHFITFLLIGLSLSFDSFAVSVSMGIINPQIRFLQANKIAFSLAFFQALFPMLGWYIGSTIEEKILPINHWISFGLLAFIGGKMIIEGAKHKDSPLQLDPFKLSVLIGLSIATSIDAFVVGLSFGFLEAPIIFPSAVIGFVTFIAAMLGLLFGKNISVQKSHHSLILGGIILIGIGTKILAENLWF